MHRFGILCLGLLFLLTAGGLVSPAKAHNYPCDDHNAVRFTVNTTMTVEYGGIYFTAGVGQCEPIIELRQGAVEGKGHQRWWGVNEVRRGHRLPILHPITGEKGRLLNVAPSDYLIELFAEVGIELPALPENAVRVTVDVPYYYLDYLNVRSGPDAWEFHVGHALPGQVLFITDVVLQKQGVSGVTKRVRVWGKVYSVYGENWVALRTYLKTPGQNNWVGLGSNIVIENWDALVVAYPWLSEHRP